MKKYIIIYFCCKIKIMTEFDDDVTINDIIRRVNELNDTEKNLFINSINNIKKKKEYTEEEKSERKKNANEKRKETIAKRKAETVKNDENKLKLEEKVENKKIVAEKRKITLARKKKERDDIRIVDDTSSDDSNNVKTIKLVVKSKINKQ